MVEVNLKKSRSSYEELGRALGVKIDAKNNFAPTLF